jgi:GLPGLI family protein
MKKFLLFPLLFVLLTLNTFAQDLQPVDSTKWLCTYEYNFLLDSTNQNSLRHDQMYLQIGSHLSKFTCALFFLQDSALYFTELKNLDMATTINQVMKSTNGVKSSTLSMYRIYKNFPGKGLMTFNAFDDKYYKVEQPMKMKWKLVTQKDTVIFGYSCQMARISYAGRDWVAWYSPQIPVADGPYKFNGLPGLILNISDTRNQHCFTLNAIKKVTYDQLILKSTRISVDITAEEYIKAKRNDLMRLYGSLQNGTITSSSEEANAQAMHGIISKNNFIEKYKSAEKSTK